MAKHRSSRHNAAQVIQNDQVLEGGTKDIVILVVGMTGSGRSTFINAYMGKEHKECMPVGITMDACTTNIQYCTINCGSKQYLCLEGYRIVLVDTPGLDGTKKGDLKILERIAQWLEKSYHGRNVLGGVIYLYDISQDRYTGTAHTSLELYHSILINSTLNRLVLGITKWERNDDEISEKRKKELQEIHWKSRINEGAYMQQFTGDQKSAADMIDSILHRIVQKDVVLLVMGPTGAGKSTFINAVLGKKHMHVHTELTACTLKVEHVDTIPDFKRHPSLAGYRVVIVDTPGFDEPPTDDSIIFESIEKWFLNLYSQKKVLCGIIYLHDISHNRFSGTAARNINGFHNLCGKAVTDNVAFGTTMWQNVDNEEGNKREVQQKSQWKTFIEKGSIVHRLPDDSPVSALHFFDRALDQFKSRHGHL
ncbi:P-loop containing nucleoside triphosphate hydrolase protein [Crassisporium funariophilum]|nr:P-loop containing nucleoside triphosphate hydrolase protein [Crassisporium funariophilum]